MVFLALSVIVEGFFCQQKALKTSPSLLQGQGSLTLAFTATFVYIAHHFILLRLNPFGVRLDRVEWYFERS